MKVVRLSPRKPVVAACVFSLLLACSQLFKTAAAEPARANESTFVATVTYFRTTVAGSDKHVNAVVRFQNKTKKPLILGYVRDSASAIDDQGNKYGSYSATERGMGIIAPSSIDPQFVLQPGEAGDARIDVMWKQASPNVIYGTSYTLDLTVRELSPINGTQYRVGTEHPLQFLDLKDGVPTTADAVYTGPGAPATPVGGVGNTPANFYGAGPFTAEATHIEATNPRGSLSQTAAITVKFTNVSDKPIILGYTARSNNLIDNVGNQIYNVYYNSRDAVGIGTVTQNQANADFSLEPGESRDARFQLTWHTGSNSALATSWDCSLAIETLEVLPSGQVRSTRQYTLNFTDLKPAMGGRGRAAGDRPRNGDRTTDAEKVGNILGQLLKRKK